jgi:hypothetical protein
MNRPHLTTIMTAIASLVFSYSSHANERYVALIDLPQAKVQIQTTQPVRLSDVLQTAQARTTLHPYTEGSKLFNLDKQVQIDRIKEESIQSLNRLITNPEYERLATSLLTMVKSKQYAYRELVSLDFDQIRLDNTQNPLLSGHYQLSFMTRPETVDIVGAITEPMSANFAADLTVTSYLQLATPRVGANKSYAWVISPDGHCAKVGIGYWNKEHTTVQPGSLIFVGLEDSLNRDFPSLESNLITLLKSTQEML